MDNSNKKNLIKQLAIFDFCNKTIIPEDKIQKYKKDENSYIQNNMYLCEIDEYTNTRILLGIYKCVNLIKNIFIASLACGAIAIVISLFK